MSFDIAFWRYEDTLDHDHVAVHAALLRGGRVDGLAEIEADAMIDRLAELLSGWQRSGAQTWEARGRYLQAHGGPQHLAINMSFAAARPVLLKVTTPMRRFGCGLWNPQTGRRLPGYGEAGAPGER